MWLAPEMVAYPALVFAVYGAYRVGRRRGRPVDETFEWVRVCVLAVLLGVLLAVQWRLVAGGVVRTTAGMLAGSLGVAGAVALVGLHVYEFYERREDAAPRATGG